MPPEHEFHQGEQVNIDVTVYEDDTYAAVKDVSGGTVVGAVGLKKTGAALADLEAVAGSVVDGPNGVVRVPLTPAQTLAIPARDYDVQIWVTIDSKPAVVADQKFRVHPKLV